MRSWMGTMLGAGWLSGCALAPVPHFPQSVSDGQADTLFACFALSRQGSWITGYSFERKQDGRHNPRNIRKVAQRYPQAADRLDAGMARSTTVAAVLGGGAGLVGGVLGANYVDDTSLSSPSALAALSVGGVLLVGGVILSAVWDDPFDDFVGVYNSSLRADLNQRRGAALDGVTNDPQLCEQALRPQLEVAPQLKR